MDGPRVNFKFLKDFKEQKKEEKPDGSQILNIGSCGLHTIRNAYKKAMVKTEWNLESFFKSLYYLFYNSPARHSDYIKYSKSTVFPLKFCSIRWVENFSVAGRALDIRKKISKYVSGVKKDKIVPSCKSFQIVDSALKDNLLASKLAFLQMMASEVEPYLKRLQSNDPLSPL